MFHHILRNYNEDKRLTSINVFLPKVLITQEFSVSVNTVSYPHGSQVRILVVIFRTWNSSIDKMEWNSGSQPFEVAYEISCIPDFTL